MFTVALLSAVSPGLVEANVRAPRVGLKAIASIQPDRGFVDTPFALAPTGQEIAYIETDAAQVVRLKVLRLRDKTIVFDRDIRALKGTPQRLQYIPDVDSLLLVNKSSTGQLLGAIIARDASRLRQFGPFDDIALLADGDRSRIVGYQLSTRGAARHHQVSVFSVSNGRRLKRAVLVTDESGYSAKLDFRLRYWQHGYTRATGMKGGVWDPKENQRTPDREADYDLLSRKFVTSIEIRDVLAHTRHLNLLVNHDNESTFLRIDAVADELTLVSRHGAKAVTLAQPLHHYKPASLQYRSTVGGMFFTLTIDPVNADAVARKRSDPEYLDLYYLPRGAKVAQRKGRLLLKNGRPSYRWRASTGTWAVAQRHIGFDRGGKKLVVYRFQ